MGKEYGDIPRGIFIVRGENLVLLGEIVSFKVVQVVYLSFFYNKLLFYTRIISFVYTYHYISYLGLPLECTFKLV